MSVTTDMLRLVHKATAPLRTRINMMTARIVVNALTEAGFQAVTATALAGEEIDGIEHMQPGGISHVALPGAEGLMICLGGSREAPVAIGIANRNLRPTNLTEGESALYALGALAGQLRAKPTGEIEATGSSGSADDFVAMAAKTLARLQALETAHNSHIHVTTATVGATPTPGVLSPPAIIVTPPITSVASSNLKADD